MRYAGGKWRQSTAIADAVARLIQPGQSYYEPFCGAMGAAAKTAPAARRGGAKDIFLSDGSEPVAYMWIEAVHEQWDPPKVVTRKTYDWYKANQPPRDPLTAMIGFGCSFGGAYYSAYGCKGDEHAARRARDAILKKAGIVRDAGARVSFADYRKVKYRPGSLIYFDPPYTNVTHVHSHDTFDHAEYWDFVRARVKEGHAVIVTEFNAPDDFVSVFSWGDTVAFNSHKQAMKSERGVGARDERIFMHRSQVKLLRSDIPQPVPRPAPTPVSAVPGALTGADRQLIALATAVLARYGMKVTA